LSKVVHWQGRRGSKSSEIARLKSGTAIAHMLSERTDRDSRREAGPHRSNRRLLDRAHPPL